MSVQYHLGPADEFSLGYVTPDRDRFSERLHDYEPPTRVLTGRVSLETPVYLAYTNTPTDTSGADFSYSDTPFIDAFVRVFSGVAKERERQGNPLIASKSPSLEKVTEVIDTRVDWGTTVSTVGSQLLSNLILAHALPNANHRTSLGMLLLYLQSHGYDVSAGDLEAAGVDEYIQESKRILTVRRNTTKFSILRSHGGYTVERKGGIRITLSEFDLTVDDPYTHFAERHEQHSDAFVSTVAPSSQTMQDTGKQAFLSAL